MPYSNSSLVSYTNISANKYSPRSHVIDRFTPHVFVGQITAKRGVDYFKNEVKNASANYIIGFDGKIGLSVEEKDAAWTSSSEENDRRAVTVEIASETTDPYAITDEAYKSLVNLAVDVCRRNGKKKMLWFGDKEKTLSYNPASHEMVITVHRWFKNKACPGNYLYNKLGQFASEVTAILNNSLILSDEKEEDKKVKTIYRVQIGAFSKEENAKKLLNEVKIRDFDSFVTFADGYYKVQAGAYSNINNANTQLKKMKNAGFTDAFISVAVIE